MGTFAITSAAKDFFHTPEEVDEILDRLLDNKSLDDDDDILIQYVLHLFYKNGKESTTVDEILDKVRLLTVDKIIYGLSQKGLVESDFDENGEIVSKITEQGKEVYDALVQKG